MTFLSFLAEEPSDNGGEDDDLDNSEEEEDELSSSAIARTVNAALPANPSPLSQSSLGGCIELKSALACRRLLCLHSALGSWLRLLIPLSLRSVRTYFHFLPDMAHLEPSAALHSKSSVSIIQA